MFKARLCNTRNTVWRRDVIGWMCPDTQESSTIDSPFPDEFHEDRSTRSSREVLGMDAILVSPWLSSYARGVSFSRQLYTQGPLSRASRHRRFKTISFNGRSAKCQVRHTVVSESLSITKDAKDGRMDGIHPHDSKGFVPPRNGNLQVYSREH